MQIATLANLSELIDEHRDELIVAWRGEVALLPGAEQLDSPTIIDHIPQLLTELSYNLKSDRSETSLILSPSEHGVQRWKVGFDITEVWPSTAFYGIALTAWLRSIIFLSQIKLAESSTPFLILQWPKP